jgi:hypothetical protein
MSRLLSLLPIVLLGACGVTEDDLDAALAGLATTADVEAAVDGLATTAEVAAVAASVDDAVEDALDDHLADVDHGPTVDASALTTGTLDPARLPVRLRDLSIDLFGVLPSEGVVMGTGGFGNTGLRIPDAGGNFRFSFVVPQDLVGSEMTLRVGWRTDNTSCAMSLLPNSLDRHRAGLGPPTGSSAAGLVGPAATMQAGAVASVGYVAEYSIGPGGGYPDLLPGDGLAVSLYRGADTCTGELRIVSLSVVYDAQ